jgi:hypothetical protein
VQKKRKIKMKKIIMVAAVALAAISVNAAATSWSWSTGTSVLKAGYTGQGASSAVLSGMTVYLLATTATATSDFTAQKALLTGIRDGSITTSNIDALKSNTTDKDGKIIAANGVVFDRTDVAVGAKALYYEVVFSADGQYVYISGNTSVTALDEGKTAAIATVSGASTQLRDDTGSGDFTAAGWYKVSASAVPEPTSGLLLLLGVAGLALRRKRA